MLYATGRIYEVVYHNPLSNFNAQVSLVFVGKICLRDIGANPPTTVISIILL